MVSHWHQTSSSSTRNFLWRHPTSLMRHQGATWQNQMWRQMRTRAAMHHFGVVSQSHHALLNCQEYTQRVQRAEHKHDTDYFNCFWLPCVAEKVNFHVQLFTELHKYLHSINIIPSADRSISSLTVQSCYISIATITLSLSFHTTNKLHHLGSKRMLSFSCCVSLVVWSTSVAK